jgi:hypothetical protein
MQEGEAQDNCLNLPISDRNLLDGLETADNIHHVHHNPSIAIPTIEISQYLLFS